jgi:hypothetical protein
MNIRGDNFGVIGGMTGSSPQISNVTINNVDVNCSGSIYANNLGVIGDAAEGSITDMSISGVSITCPSVSATNAGVIGAFDSGFDACTNLTITNVDFNDSKTSSSNNIAFGVIGLMSAGTMTDIHISDVNVSNSTINSYNIGTVAKIGDGCGEITGLKIDGAVIADSTIKGTVAGVGIGSLTDQVLTNTSISNISITGTTVSTSSIAGVIGWINGGATLNGTVISGVSILDSSITANDYTGAIAFVKACNAHITNTSITGITIGTDPADEADAVNTSINSRYLGIAVGFNRGIISGLTVGTHHSGITVDRSKIYAQNFGVIAYNTADQSSGFIVGLDTDNDGYADKRSEFEHITLTNLTFDRYSYYTDLNAGIIGNNNGNIYDFEMKDIVMTGWNLSSKLKTTNIGAIGTNSRLVDMTQNFTTNPVRNLTMSGFTSGTDKSAYTDYAFVGLNSGQGALARYITINDYYTEGYGAVYKNASNATISNITIDMTDHTDDIPYVIDSADPNATENRVIPHIGRDGFAYKNSSRVSTCVITNAVKDTANPENSNILGNVFIEAANNTGTIDDDCQVTDTAGTVLWPVTSRMSVAPAAVTQQPSTPSASAQSSASASASSSADSTPSASASPSPSPSPSASSATGSSASPSASAGQ